MLASDYNWVVEVSTPPHPAPQLGCHSVGYPALFGGKKRFLSHGTVVFTSEFGARARLAIILQAYRAGVQLNCAWAQFIVLVDCILFAAV